MSARTRLIGLCTGLAFAFVMTTAAIAAAELDQGGKPSKDEVRVPGLHGCAAAGSRTRGGSRADAAADHPLRSDGLPRRQRFQQPELRDRFTTTTTTQAADDFVVTGAGWSVTTVVTPGRLFQRCRTRRERAT